MTKTMREANKIDWDIDIRYENDVLVAFDKFIEKWCGINSAHLLDTDEQDGQFMRDKITKLLRKNKRLDMNIPRKWFATINKLATQARKDCEDKPVPMSVHTLIGFVSSAGTLLKLNKTYDQDSERS